MFGNSTNRQHERDQTTAPIYAFTYTYTTSLFNQYFKSVSEKKNCTHLHQKNPVSFQKKYISERREAQSNASPTECSYLYTFGCMTTGYEVVKTK